MAAEPDVLENGVGNGPDDHPPLTDKQGRAITYLRLAITDRCNLRCRYCMPQDKVQFVSHVDILRYEEMVRLVGIFARLGIRKIRVTGGEPFVRRDCIAFFSRLKVIPGIKELFITTNGIAAAAHLDSLVEIGISGINLSLDTLDPERFLNLTEVDGLAKAMNTFHGAIDRQIPLKVNTVVLEETTDDDLYGIAALAREYPVTVRFIEKMPFSGGNMLKNGSSGELRKRLKAIFPLTREVPGNGPSTARLYELDDYKGKIGVIEGHSRKFCATCNKIRVTPLGILKTCLYDNGTLNLRDMLRCGADDNTLVETIAEAVNNRFSNGLEAEKMCFRNSEPSMASIGG